MKNWQAHFWPDTTDEAARKNLRQELWRIRKAAVDVGTGDIAGTGVVHPMASNKISETFVRLNIVDMALSSLYLISDLAVPKLLISPRGLG